MSGLIWTHNQKYNEWSGVQFQVVFWKFNCPGHSYTFLILNNINTTKFRFLVAELRIESRLGTTN